METEKPNLTACLVITGEEAAAADSGEKRRALLEMKLANLRSTVILASGEKWGWEYAMNTTGVNP